MDELLMIGATLGRYRLDALLGEGGMGKVYRAFDESLGRSAAIKLLPAEVSEDAERLERFTREARTASVLSHPNIVTIYEVGAVNGQHFIAMELVEGDTLRERLLRGRLELPRALELMAQVADGVATAHAAGIVHRDLKPENIVIAKNGFAKILDFGLAKLRALPAGNDEGATMVKASTTPGVILGTIGYMAPEQARGEEVDHRSDIFAIGCILYEAVAGTRAFRGESAVDTLHKIIYGEPPPLSEAAPEIPAEVQRIVRKCLAKDREQRYQSAKDIAIDLRDVKRELESQPSTRAIARAPRSRAISILAIVVLLAAAAATAWWIAQRDDETAPVPTAKPRMSITRLTSSGNVIGAAISPDGEYLAYAYSDAARHSLWVRQTATTSVLQVVPPAPGGFWGLTFSPDSRSIYYAFKTPDDPAGTLYQVPILGGPPRKVVERVDSHPHFSPDGKQMLFLRQHEPQRGHSALVIANADGTNQRVLLSKAPPESLLLFWGAPDWSPDGKSIVFALRNRQSARLFVADVATGRTQPFSKDEWGFLGDVRWLADGSGLLVACGESQNNVQLWFVSRDGAREPITNDLYVYRIVSTTRGDQELVSVAADATSAIWRVALDGSMPPVKVTNARYDGFRGVAAAADGTIYFNTADAARVDIWSVDTRGERRQITSGERVSQSVAVSPDQKYLVTTMLREHDRTLMRLNRDGSGPKVLCPVVTPSSRRVFISFTPDSKTVVFDSAIDGVSRIWRVPIEGGTPVQLAEGETPAVSPDGSKLAWLQPGSIVVASIDSATPLRTFSNLGVTNFSMIRWSSDGKGIFHNAGPNDRMNVWYQPLDGGEGRPITRFDDEVVHAFDVTPDGKELVVARGVLSRDAVLIRNWR